MNHDIKQIERFVRSKIDSIHYRKGNLSHQDFASAVNSTIEKFNLPKATRIGIMQPEHGAVIDNGRVHLDPNYFRIPYTIEIDIPRIIEKSPTRRIISRITGWGNK